MAYNNILVEKENLLAVVTINRPPVNALNIETIDELAQAFAELKEDPAVRAVIITGAGQYTFVAGADIAGFTQIADETEGLRLIKKGQDLFTSLETFPKPVIAAVNGVCLGGGCELAMACDLRIAAESARFGQPEINLGIIPGWGGTQRMPRLIGKSKAMELLLTGDMIKAADALRFGLVNKVVPDNELMAQTKNLARKLAMQAPLAVAAIKKATFEGLSTSVVNGLDVEAQAFVDVFRSEDAREGISAFLGKRRPQFKGK